MRRAIGKRKIVVLGVFSPRRLDDRPVRKPLGEVDKLQGSVLAHAMQVKRIARYGHDHARRRRQPVADGGDRRFATARSRRSSAMSTATIDQAVIDAMRYSGTLYADAYLKQVAQACTHLFPDLQLLLEPTSVSDAEQIVGKAGVQLGQFKRELASLPTPKKWRSFSKATQADVATMSSTLASTQASLGAHPTAATFAAADTRYTPALTRAGNRLNQRFAKHDLISCQQG